MPGDLTISVDSDLSSSDGATVVHGIQPMPSFPALTATAFLQDPDLADASSLTFSWRFEVAYQDQSRSDLVKYPDDGTMEASQGPVWYPAMPTIAGGDLVIYCSVEFPDGSTLTGSTDPGAHRILGANPEKSVVRNSLPPRTVYAAVVWQESRFTQFKDTQGISSSFVSGYHYPIRGFDPRGTIGYGLAQLTSPAPEVHDLWDWTWNVSNAMSRLNAFRDDAMTYCRQVQGGSPWSSATGGRPPNEGTAYPDAPDFTDNELDLEMLARWNGGYRYHDFDPDSGSWQRRLPPGQDAGTSLPYADRVLDVAAQVDTGNDPPGWD